MKKLTVRQVVGAGACDPSGGLSLVGALTLIEDAITATMAQLKLDGFTVRREYGALMVFAKNHLRFLEPIMWRDIIKVSCFISSQSAARLNVDVSVKKAGKIALYARTEVCAIDEKTGRIRRMDSVGAGKQVHVVRAPYDLSWQSMDGDGKLVDKVKVCTSNIDYAGHTNNVEYLRLLLNTFSLEKWRGMDVHELQVAYLSQSFLGDELAIYRCDLPTEYPAAYDEVFTFKRADKDVLRCRLNYWFVDADH